MKKAEQERKHIDIEEKKAMKARVKGENAIVKRTKQPKRKNGYF